MKRSLHFFTVAVVAVLLTTGCYNAVEQQLQHGNYDAVLKASLDRMDRSRKRDEYISMAHRAYDKVMGEDIDQISQLKARNSDNRNWGKIYYLYKRMDERQRILERYLPLTYLNGNEVDIELYNLDPVIEESREYAAAYHYDRAISYLEAGNRRAARYAYSELNDIDQYFYDFKDVEALRAQAVNQGTNKILITFNKAYEVYLPESFTEELAYHDYERLMGPWSKLYREVPDSNIFDYAIELTVEHLEISPQHLKEIHYSEEQEVQDGTQPLVNEEGNYVTDTSGNIIQVPKYKILYCHITEWNQNRSALVVTGFKIHDMRTQQLIVHQDLEDHAIFENTYARANGHLEILGPAIIQKLESLPQPFPNDYEMAMLTSNGLKRQISNAIQRNVHILEDV